MPIVSKAQQGWAYAHKDDPTAEGKAAKDFVAAGPKGGAFSQLPDRVGRTQNRHVGGALKQGFQHLVNKSRSMVHGSRRPGS